MVADVEAGPLSFASASCAREAAKAMTSDRLPSLLPKIVSYRSKPKLLLELLTLNLLMGVSATCPCIGWPRCRGFSFCPETF